MVHEQDDKFKAFNRPCGDHTTILITFSQANVSTCRPQCTNSAPATTECMFEFDHTQNGSMQIKVSELECTNKVGFS